MNTGQSAGIAALQQSITSDNHNENEMKYMQQLAGSAEKERALQETAQLQEQQYYEMLNTEAENLLAGDKKKISNKALQLQQAVKEQLKVHGGDRKKFLQGGGHMMLKKYVDTISNSEEMGMFKSNKENMVKIMDAQAKGMGHLIVKSDLDSLQKYQANGEGEISFSGVMTEVEMPDANNYDLGEDIPVGDILNNSSNRMRITANWMLENPGQEPTEEQLMAFTKARYGGEGSNRDRINFLRKQYASQMAAKKAGSDKAIKDTQRTHIGVQLDEAYNYITRQGYKASDILGDYYQGTEKDLYKELGDDTILGNTSEWDITGTSDNLDEEGWDTEGKGDYRVGVAGGRRLYSGLEPAIAKQLFNKELNEDGTIELQPDETWLDPKGEQTKGTNRLEFDEYKGNYTIKGVTLGYMTKNENGNNSLVMRFMDDEGNLDKEQQKEYMDGLKAENASVQPREVMAVENEDGNLFYIPIPKDQGFRNQFFNNNIDALESTDKTSLERQESAMQDESLYQANLQGEEQIKQFHQHSRTLDEMADFETENMEYTEKGNPRKNRSRLLKSFYLVNEFPAMAAEQGTFSAMMSFSDDEFMGKLKDHSKYTNDFVLVDEWLKTASKAAVNEKEKADYIRFAQQWKSQLNNIKEYGQ